MPTSVSGNHLETQRGELSRRYDILTKRIAALDTDIGRELDSERKLILQERRAQLAAERDQIAVDTARLEQQVTPSSTAATVNADSASTPASSPAERASLERQLAAQRENLMLIEERLSEFVSASDPANLQLVKNKRNTEAHIAELEVKLGLRSSA